MFPAVKHLDQQVVTSEGFFVIYCNLKNSDRNEIKEKESRNSFTSDIIRLT